MGGAIWAVALRVPWIRLRRNRAAAATVMPIMELALEAIVLCKRLWNTAEDMLLGVTRDKLDVTRWGQH